MLNIETRISLSKSSKNRIKKYWKSKGGNLNGKSWGSIHKSVKNELSKKLFLNQRFKCCYCERHLTGLSPQIDHFAHQAVYSRFCFNPTNLFYACGFCNSASIKGQKDTVDVFNLRYDLTTFLIVHPLRDNPDNEIIFQDSDRVYLDIDQCTELGVRTISFFKYDELLMTTIRAKHLKYQRMDPLTTEEENDLIQKSIAYK